MKPRARISRLARIIVAEAGPLVICGMPARNLGRAACIRPGSLALRGTLRSGASGELDWLWVDVLVLVAMKIGIELRTVQFACGVCPNCIVRVEKSYRVITVSFSPMKRRLSREPTTFFVTSSAPS